MRPSGHLTPDKPRSSLKELGTLICKRDPAVVSRHNERLHAEMAANSQGTVRQSLIPGLNAGFLSASHHGPRDQLFLSRASKGSTATDAYSPA
ncbi:hypothetical protein R54767_04023 [Paraburkholderia gardini]|uniref:Uncharacterized protein n=1 Tax=Paraburkholderia gardini TaxID=2823469 RepID=A0ABN7QRG1_9BURK|nr:hypothetical protein R54767_04023 [Paraburkholderia gardini]